MARDERDETLVAMVYALLWQFAVRAQEQEQAAYRKSLKFLRAAERMI
jgi:hypothetical protein